jgi:NitT/TauT family transport system permease protein
VVQLVEDIDVIWGAPVNTGFVAVTGLLAGVILGLLLALAVTASRSAGELIAPVAVAVDATPIIALAPIFNAWFGLLPPTKRWSSCWCSSRCSSTPPGA